MALQHRRVGDQCIHNARPGHVERLVPYRGGQTRELQRLALVGQDAASLGEDPLAHLLLHQVHLVHQTKDARRGGVVAHGFQAINVGMQVSLELARLDVKDVDEHLDVAEDVVALCGQVVLHEGVLAPAVPEVEGQVAEEADVRVLDVDRGAQPPCVLGDVVGEDDGAHRGLAGAALAHQQHLLAQSGGHPGSSWGYKHMHDTIISLGAIPLQKSPFVKLPSAVTLPFSYAALPPSLQHVAPTDLSFAEQATEHCRDTLASMDEHRRRSRAEYAEWLELMDRKELERKRRIAPGYLDSEQKLLQPSSRSNGPRSS